MAIVALAAALLRPATLSAEGYLVDVWDTDRGLPSSSVSAIAQTPEGYLWAGTHNGLVRFDGVRFEAFDPVNTPELGHARIDNLFVDAAGTLWINGFDGSLTSWRRGVFAREWTGKGALDPGAWLLSSRSDRVTFLLETGEVIRRPQPSPPGSHWQVLRPQGARLVPVSCEDRDGGLWIRSADHQVWRLAGSTFTAVAWQRGLAGRRVNHLAADRAGRVWIATEREIAAWTDGRFEVQTPPSRVSRTDVSFLFFVRNGDYWAIVNGRAHRARGRSWVQELRVGPDLTGAYRTMLSALEDREGGVWLAHYGKGLLHVRRDGQARAVTLAEGLPGERIRCTFQDREGNLWLGIDRGGLVRLRERRFRVLRPGVSSAAAVSSVMEDAQGTVWMGTLGGGLNRWRDGVLDHFPLPAATSGEFVFSLYPDARGRLFMSADHEDLFIFDGKQARRAPWQVHGIKALLVDRRDRLWLGRKDGLSCLEAGRLRSFGPQDGFEPSDVRALAEDRQGAIWIGAGDGSVYRFAGDLLQPFRPAGALARQAVWSLMPDAAGTLWVGTFRGGLLRLRDGRFTRVTAKDGLPSDVVCQILEDEQERLWLGTHQGIVRIAKASLNAFADGKARSVSGLSYGRSDGLPTLECSGSYQPSSWRGHDGRLWFATTKGVVGVQPRTMGENRLPPPVVIEQVLADGEPQSLRFAAAAGDEATLPRDAVAPPPPTVEIAPGNRHVELRYTGLSLTAPDKVLFRYRLEGLEREWVEAGGRRTAQYSYLRPGRYRFRVIACNSDGVWNESGASLTLRVLPRFFESWWFSSGMGLLAVGFVAGAARYLSTRRLRSQLERLDRQRAVERDRARIAKDIHDDLGAGLTQITLLSELARGDSPQEADSHLAQISDTARELTRTMDEIVWAVNPQNDTLDSLTSYLCSFAHEYLTLAGIQCRLDVPAQLPAQPLSAEIRHNLFLAVKEALNNVVKHAQAREVWLRLTALADSFVLVIEDDGLGFVAGAATGQGGGRDRVSSGHGLGNLERRLGSIGGRCLVSSVPGRGTRVELSVASIGDSRRIAPAT